MTFFFALKNSKSYLNSLKDNLYNLVLSEFNRLIFPYNLLISLDLIEINGSKNDSTDWLCKTRKN